MRVLRTIFIAVIAVWCVAFLARFARIQYLLWQMREDRGIHLLAEPHICIYRAFTHGHGERDGWTLFLLTDAPEGTRSVFYFPTWPLAVASAGVLIYAAYSILSGEAEGWPNKKRNVVNLK